MKNFKDKTLMEMTEAYTIMLNEQNEKIYKLKNLPILDNIFSKMLSQQFDDENTDLDKEKNIGKIKWKNTDGSYTVNGDVSLSLLDLT